jgi:tetratricopeptide (TPR) repeat protein
MAEPQQGLILISVDHPEFISRSRDLAFECQKLRRYDDAVALFFKSLAASKSCGQHSETGITMDKLGSLYLIMRQYDQALLCKLEALSIAKGVWGTEHLNLAISYNNLGTIYVSRKEYTPAFQSFLCAVNILDKLLVANQVSPNSNLSAIFSNCGITCLSLSQPEDALTYLFRALEILNQMPILDDLEIGICLNNIGSAYLSACHYSKAVEFCLTGLFKKLQSVGMDHPSTITSLINASFALRALGQTGLAVPYAMGSLASTKNMYLKKLVKVRAVVDCLENVGSLYLLSKQYDQALLFYSEALEINLENPGMYHKRTAVSFDNIASIHLALGNRLLAFENYEKTLHIVTNVIGIPSVEAAALFHKVGSLNSLLGRNKEALSSHLKSFEMRKLIFGCEHPDTLGSLQALGLCHASLGNSKDALAAYLPALQAKIRLLGNDHYDVLVLLQNVGLLYSSSQRHKDAYPYLFQVFNLLRSKNGTEHLDTLLAFSNVLSTLQALGSTSDVFQFHLEAHGAVKKQCGPISKQTALSCISLGHVCSLLGKTTETLHYYLESLHIRKAIFSEHHPDIVISSELVAAVHTIMKNLEKALDLYLEILETKKVTLGPNHSCVGQAHNTVGSCLNAQQRWKEALPHHFRALSIFQAHNFASLNLSDFYHSLIHSTYHEISTCLKKTHSPLYRAIQNKKNLKSKTYFFCNYCRKIEPEAELVRCLCLQALYCLHSDCAEQDWDHHKPNCQQSPIITCLSKTC